jgi:ribosomal protein S18 acetylase RimI-like enzyme
MIKIRPMTESDHTEVSQLLCACYRELGRVLGLRPEAVEFLLSRRGSLESIRSEASSQTFLVAEAGGQVLGMVAIKGSTVAKLYVSPPDQGRGIGKALFGAAEAAIREAGYDHLTLGSNRLAVDFYRAMGAELTGRKRAKLGPLAGMDIFIMGKRLTPK